MFFEWSDHKWSENHLYTSFDNLWCLVESFWFYHWNLILWHFAACWWSEKELTYIFCAKCNVSIWWSWSLCDLVCSYAYRRCSCVCWFHTDIYAFNSGWLIGKLLNYKIMSMLGDAKCLNVAAESCCNHVHC